MEFEGHQTAPAPAVLYERSFSAAVSDVKICPNARLFAVVLDRVSIAIFRINCHRLATISVCTKEQETITSYNWSPDGANIVVASSSANLSIYSIDRCSLSASRTRRSLRDSDIVATVTLPASASCLAWSSISGAPPEIQRRFDYAAGYQDRASVFYDNSLTLSHVAPGGLLLVGDEEGCLTLYTHDLQLKIARVQILPKDVAVHRVLMSPNHSYALSLAYQSSCNEEGDSGASRCFIRVLNLQPVSEYWPEIYRVNMESVSTNVIKQSFSDAIARLQKEWKEGAMNVLTARIQKSIEKRMKDFAEDVKKRNAWGALHDTYCGAFMKSALLQFLGTDLSESGAKEALRSFRAHADDVEETIVKTLPIAEKMMFRASEYRGLARMKWRFAPVGVLLDEANEMFEASEAFYLALQELMYESQKMSREAEAFLAWLVIAAAKAGGASVERRDQAVTLDNMSTKDRQLVSDFLERMSGDIGNKPKLGDSVSDLLNSRLARAYQKFEEVVQSVFQTPAREITTQLEVCGELLLASGPNRYVRPYFSKRETVVFSSEKQQILFCLTQCDGSLMFIQYDLQSQRWKVCRADVVLEKVKMLVKHAACVREDEILILGEIADKAGEINQPRACLAFYHRVSQIELFNGRDDSFRGGDLDLTSVSVSKKLQTRESSMLHVGQPLSELEAALSAVNDNRFASILIKPNKVSIVGFEHDAF
ncbi:unnamed protein product [Agarophyton chilense]